MSLGMFGFIPNVTYEYHVNGSALQGDRVSYASRGYWRFGSAAKIAHSFPVGSEVVVHYDPESPSRSVLRTGVDKRPVIALFGCALFLVSGLLSML
jgi:hypothetical protein